MHVHMCVCDVSVRCDFLYDFFVCEVCNCVCGGGGGGWGVWSGVE